MALCRDEFLSGRNSYEKYLLDKEQPWYRARMQQQQQGLQDEEDCLLQSHRPHELRVTNIPEGLEESGLRNLFSRHGRVVDVFLKKGTTGPSFGKVALATFEDAMTAKQRLHRTEPFRLQVFNVLPETGEHR